MSRLTLLLVGAAVSGTAVVGCSCATSHEATDAGATVDATDRTDAPGAIDAGYDARPDDAGGRHDAGPRGDRFFTLVPGDLDLAVEDERCAAREPATTVLHAQVHYFSTCDTPGPISVAIDEGTHTVEIHAQLWREEGRSDCAAVGAAFHRDVIVRGLTAGTWTVTFGAAGSFLLVVDARSPSACAGLVPIPEGGSCTGDCDCDTGLSCVALRGDAVCDMRCQAPCEADDLGSDLGLECAPSRECTVDPNVGSICTPRTMDLCGPSSPCPPGMRCVSDSDAASFCEWTIELTGSTRHACAVNGDCDAGLDCVHHADGSRRCEVRCDALGMRCPNNAPHACNDLGVCEWLGE